MVTPRPYAAEMRCKRVETLKKHNFLNTSKNDCSKHETLTKYFASTTLEKTEKSMNTIEDVLSIESDYFAAQSVISTSDNRLEKSHTQNAEDSVHSQICKSIGRHFYFGIIPTER